MPIGWFCARCGKLIGCGETRPAIVEHECVSPFKDDKLPYVEFTPIQSLRPGAGGALEARSEAVRTPGQAK